VWLWTGGALSVLIILAITVASPRIGLAATIGILIAFNLSVAAVIDGFGWFGFDRIPIGWTRVLGILLLGAGAVLSLQKSV
jgi:bacterial/archaeal transporter family-2 protein